MVDGNFPQYRDGDVVIYLSKSPQYVLHSAVLSQYSEVFKISLQRSFLNFKYPVTKVIDGATITIKHFQILVDDGDPDIRTLVATLALILRDRWDGNNIVPVCPFTLIPISKALLSKGIAMEALKTAALEHRYQFRTQCTIDDIPERSKEPCMLNTCGPEIFTAVRKFWLFSIDKVSVWGMGQNAGSKIYLR